MNAAPIHTAVLLFTRTAADEVRVKQFCTAKGKNRAIAAQLISRTKQVVQQAGLPLIVVDSGQQRGSSFGERLQHAFQKAFDAGYEQVICLGNDSPGLTPALLRSAAIKLQQQDFVFGAAADGGVYLMGMHRRTLPLLDFRAVTWQSSLVFEELRSQTATAQVAVLAPVLQDADDATTILSLSGSHSLGRFARFLQALLNLLQPPISYYTSLLFSGATTMYGLRAPPAA